MGPGEIPPDPMLRWHLFKIQADTETPATL